MPARDLPIFLTVDLGPDDAVRDHDHERGARWERSTAGVAALLDVGAALQRATGLALRCTWFVRADGHLARTEGDALAAHARFAGFLRARRAEGDLVGWMPQAYAAGREGVDLADLAATHARLREAGWDPVAVRMGGCFHDDATMAQLDALGIRVDCSALPGRRKDDGGWRLDWRGTPAGAYRPSRADFRRPGRPALRLLELPLSMLPIRAGYDPAPLARYLDPTMRPALLADGAAALVREADYLQCVLHPDALVPTPPGGGHPLLAYSQQACLDNLVAMVAHARAAARTPGLDTVDHAEGAVREHDAASAGPT